MAISEFRIMLPEILFAVRKDVADGFPSEDLFIRRLVCDTSNSKSDRKKPLWTWKHQLPNQVPCLSHAFHAFSSDTEQSYADFFEPNSFDAFGSRRARSMIYIKAESLRRSGALAIPMDSGMLYWGEGCTRCRWLLSKIVRSAVVPETTGTFISPSRALFLAVDTSPMGSYGKDFKTGKRKTLHHCLFNFLNN
eukprot:scaffold921_cov126-Cylindrotheca_fusiformis.AAC.7